MTGVGITDASGISTVFPFSASDSNVVLDSGCTTSYLHQSLVDSIVAKLNGFELPYGRTLVADCRLRNTSATMDFAFGGDDAGGPAITIRVPLSDFIRTWYFEQNGRKYCGIGVSATDSQQVLGDTFLRAGYFVFDWDNQAVHMAQADDCGSEILAIGAGTDSVPEVTGNCAMTWSEPQPVRLQSFSSHEIITPADPELGPNTVPIGPVAWCLYDSPRDNLHRHVVPTHQPNLHHRRHHYRHHSSRSH